MLDNFIAYTNYCEDKGYEFKMSNSPKGITCSLYKDGKLIKEGSKYFESFIIAQRECYTLLFNKIHK